MKRRKILVTIASVILAFGMVCSTAYAGGESVNPPIQSVIDACREMEVVLSNPAAGVEELKEANQKVVAAFEVLDDAEHEELEKSYSECWDVMSQANVIIGMSEALDGYEQSKNAGTASTVVDVYELHEPTYGQLLGGWFPDIAAIYDQAYAYVEAIGAYGELRKVLSEEVGNVDALEAANQKVVAANEKLVAANKNLGDNEFKGLEVHDPDCWKVMSQANVIIGMSGALDGYAQNKSAETALKVVNVYEEHADYGQLLGGWFTDIAAIYDQACAYVDIPSAIGAYDELKEVLSNQVGNVDALEAANEKVVAEIEKLDADKLQELEVYDSVCWKVMSQANVIIGMSDALDGYAQNKNAETALQVVNVYEQHADYGQLLAGWFPDIAAIYDEACAYVDVVDEDENDKDKDEGDKGASPKTGDSADMMVPFVVMMAAACVIVAIAKRKVTK